MVETLAVNVTSPYAAAVQAVKLWSTLPDTPSKTFLFTGNMTSTQLWPTTHSLGIGKNATAYVSFLSIPHVIIVLRYASVDDEPI